MSLSYRRLGREKIVDGLTVLLLVALLFLLGCRESLDDDLWWHLKAGDWILSEGRVPRLDPFAFGNENRLWIDLHWGFQVMLALAYRCGGIAGTTLLSASVASLALLIGLLGSARKSSQALTALCWLPAIWLIASRVSPRPEMLSMFFLASFLALLERAERSPRLLWALPILQVLWVNMHGLFILGPIVLACHGAALIVRLSRRGSPEAPGRISLRQSLMALAACCAACLANPYFVDGALFPLELLPKVTVSGNAYKESIDEFRSPASYLIGFRPNGPRGEWNMHSQYFLLISLPLSFLAPAIWRAADGAQRSPAGRSSTGGPASKGPEAKLASLALPFLIAIAAAWALPSKDAPGWISAVESATPAAMLLWALCAAAVFGKRRRQAAQLAILGGLAMMAWLLWAPLLLFGAPYAPAAARALSPLLPWVTAAFALPTVFFTLRLGGSAFRLLIAVAFAYLSLNAMRNLALFGLVGGSILAWNLGEWAAELAASREFARWRRPAGWGASFAAVALLAAAIFALVTGRLYRWSGDSALHVSLGELPLAFPHEAARFAGKSTLPRRAVVYDLGLSSLYLYYNSPGAKPYIDPRLELPDVETFKNYLQIDDWLNARDPRGVQAIRKLGDPLAMLLHKASHEAEAELFSRPDWKCVYYDALASIFVLRGETAEPEIDFAELHFSASHSPSTPPLPGAALREGIALHNLGATLRRDSSRENAIRIPALLRSVDRLRLALDENSNDARAWSLLGNCYRNLSYVEGAESIVFDHWRVEPGLFWAQASYCYRRAADEEPDNAAAWRSMYDSFRARRIPDAQLDAAERLLSLSALPTNWAAQVLQLRTALQPVRQFQAVLDRIDDPRVVARLLDDRQLQTAVLLAESMQHRSGRNWPWPLADRIATAYMHLGYPARAREIWQAAREAPSEAVRLCRIADAYAAQGDEHNALLRYRQAADADPQFAEPWLASVILHVEAGRAKAAEECCQTALEASASAEQRRRLESFVRLLDAVRSP